MVQEELIIKSWKDFISQSIWKNPRIKTENKTIVYKIWGTIKYYLHI